MTTIWHLVTKDLRRLAWPVALLSAATVGKIIFYASIAGVHRTPDPGWLNRLYQGPEFFLRAFAESIIAYFLVGWLVFEDSPVEKDAHWVTRPISGWQLFTAKLAAAILLFALLPLLLNLPWWLACGFSWPEVALSSAELVAVQFVLVAMGLAAASITDGFPRFVLWSLVACGGFAMVQMVFLPLAGPNLNEAVSRLIVWCLSGSLVALAITAHQFVTRRHRKSLALTVAGILVVVAVGAAWHWDFTYDNAVSFTPESITRGKLEVKLIGPPQARDIRGRRFAELALHLSGIPRNAAVTQIQAGGDWSFNGVLFWMSPSGFKRSGFAAAIQHIAEVASSPDGYEADETVPLPLSLPLLQRARQEPAIVRASFRLEVCYGEIVAELPLREGKSDAAPSFTISLLTQGPWTARRPAKGTVEKPSEKNAVRFVVTQRSAFGLLANSRARPSQIEYALVDHRTGQVFLSDPARSGPIAMTPLNQTWVLCWQLLFPTGASPVDLNETKLVVIRFRDRDSIKREVLSEPLSVLVEPADAPEGETEPRPGGY